MTVEDSTQTYEHWDAESTMSALEEFIEQHNRFPTARDMGKKGGLPARRTFERINGMTLLEYGKQHHPELVVQNKLRHIEHAAMSRLEMSTWTKEMLVEAVTDFYEQHERLPYAREYKPENGLPNYGAFHKIAADDLNEYLMDAIDHAQSLEDSGMKMQM